jgi:hypothetical protein
MHFILIAMFVFFKGLKFARSFFLPQDTPVSLGTMHAWPGLTHEIEASIASALLLMDENVNCVQ